MGNRDNYERVRYEVLAQLSYNDRALQVEQTCRAAKVRMPVTKTRYILGCFELAQEFGGSEAAKQKLLAQPDRDAQIRFLKALPGISDKYARNIMMDVYYEDFWDSIAIDVRIQSVSNAWGLLFSSYEEYEKFYLAVAAKAGLNGWELDRLMFNFTSEFLPKEPKRLTD